MIAGFNTSFIDYDSKIALIIYFCGCNFKCPYCSNYKLRKTFSGMDISLVLKHLEDNLDFYEAIVISGGEPCFWKEYLILFMKKLKEIAPEHPIKLDTNGTYFEVLSQIVMEKLVKIVAVDIKQDIFNFEKMSETIGKNYTSECAVNILKSIQFLQKQSEVFTIFRTTLIPSITEADFGNMLRILITHWDKSKNEFHLQKFDPDLTEYLIPGPYLKPDKYIKILEAYDINYKLKNF